MNKKNQEILKEMEKRRATPEEQAQTMREESHRDEAEVEASEERYQIWEEESLKMAKKIDEEKYDFIKKMDIKGYREFRNFYQLINDEYQKCEECNFAGTHKHIFNNNYVYLCDYHFKKVNK